MATSHAAGYTATSNVAACCGFSICCSRALAMSSLNVLSCLRSTFELQTCSGFHL